jgi:hypothetical protein
MNNIYDNRQFFDQYSKMSRSQQGLSGAGEWHQFKALFPDLSGKSWIGYTKLDNFSKVI